MRTGHSRISKRLFYRMGAFKNPNLFRTDRGSGWEYYEVIDNAW